MNLAVALDQFVAEQTDSTGPADELAKARADVALREAVLASGNQDAIDTYNTRVGSSTIDSYNASMRSRTPSNFAALGDISAKDVPAELKDLHAAAVALRAAVTQGL